MKYPIFIKTGLSNGENCSIGNDTFAHAEGFETSASGKYAHSEGKSTIANGEGSHASGVNAVAEHANSSVWNGDPTKTVKSLGDGTIVINPVGGLSGIFVGENTLQSYLDDTKGVLEFASRNDFPEKGDNGKIYVANDTNLTYRWNGEEYADIVSKGVGRAELIDLGDDYTPETLQSAINAINKCLRASMACLFSLFTIFVPNEAESDDTPTNPPNRVVVRDLGDMSSMRKQFNAMKTLTNVVTDVNLYGLVTKDEVGEMLQPTPSIGQEQTERGITYENRGIMQDGAIQIGRHAVATVDPAYIETAPSGTVLRSVSVAIGDYADARKDGSGQSQSIAIGWFAQAKESNAIAIGSGAQHTNETAMSGGATVATGSEAIAIGYSAKATAAKAVQIGFGTNSTARSLQFLDIPIVKDGKLATLSTNDVQSMITNFVNTYLAPCTVKALPPDGVISVKAHAVTTLTPTNDTPIFDDVILESNASRNYKVFIPNVTANRISLPVLFDTEDDSFVKLGGWWKGKVLTLPIMVSVCEPADKTVILDIEAYDDGWDWTPVVTNATWEATEDGAARRLKKVMGYNLQGVTAVRVAYEGTDGATNVVASTAVGDALYGAVWPTVADIAEADIAAGTEVVVSVVVESVSAPKATLNALTESVTEILKSEKGGWR